MTKGTIKMFNNQKGFGFISCEDGTEVFFHHTAVQGTSADSLKEGQAVEFQMGQGPKGKRAEDVKLVK
jgi:CspA family cold shock protein